MDRCLLSILPATAYMLSTLISHTFGALEAKIPRGSLTDHTVWLLTLLEMVMLVTLYESSYSEVYDGGWHAINIWQWWWFGSKSPNTTNCTLHQFVQCNICGWRMQMYCCFWCTRWSTWRSMLWYNLPQKPMCNSCNGCAQEWVLHVCNRQLYMFRHIVRNKYSIINYRDYKIYR